MSADVDHFKGQFMWIRFLLGLAALAFALFLLSQYIRFLMDIHYKILFRLVFFFFGQIISLIFATWAAVLIGKKYTCPCCKEGIMVVPLSELYFFLPTLPWTPKILSYFTLRDQESLLLKNEKGKITGECPLCQKSIFDLKLAKGLGGNQTF